MFDRNIIFKQHKYHVQDGTKKESHKVLSISL